VPLHKYAGSTKKTIIFSFDCPVAIYSILTRVGKNPVFFLNQPSGFFGCFGVFCFFWGFLVFYIFAQKREFLGFFVNK
jgi:hypothetical protein